MIYLKQQAEGPPREQHLAGVRALGGLQQQLDHALLPILCYSISYYYKVIISYHIIVWYSTV